MTMQYDLAGRRTHLFYPDGFEIRYSYDLDDALRLVTQAGVSTIAGFTYDDLGRRTALTRGNGVTTTYGYDGGSRMNALAHDLAGTGSDVTYGLIYNPASQVGVRSISNPAYLYTPSAGAQALTRNGLNQPTSVNSVAMSSDARGNLTNDGVRAYTFDSANRMTGTGTSTLAYGPLDRLVEMTGTAGGVYLYDGDMITAVKVPAAPTINNRLIRGPWPDELLVAYQGNTASTPLWSLQDHQASTVAITDAAGTAPYTLAYDEYGQPRAGNAGRMMFTGQLWLPDFGLYHYKARAYHPGLGRFMQTDPVGYAQGMNLYAYVGLDPVNRTDPSGNTCEITGEGRSSRLSCKLDDPGDLTEEQVRAAEKAYTDAVNRLMANGNRRVHLYGQSRSVSAREVAAVLFYAYVEGDATTNVGRAAAPGSNSDGTARSGGRRDRSIIIYGRAMNEDLAGRRGTSRLQEDLQTTFVHEGIHHTTGEIRHRGEHNDFYNNAAKEILSPPTLLERIIRR